LLIFSGDASELRQLFIMTQDSNRYLMV